MVGTTIQRGPPVANLSTDEISFRTTPKSWTAVVIVWAVALIAWWVS